MRRIIASGRSRPQRDCTTDLLSHCSSVCLLCHSAVQHVSRLRVSVGLTRHNRQLELFKSHRPPPHESLPCPNSSRRLRRSISRPLLIGQWDNGATARVLAGLSLTNIAASRARCSREQASSVSQPHSTSGNNEQQQQQPAGPARGLPAGRVQQDPEQGGLSGGLGPTRLTDWPPGPVQPG